MKYNCLLVWIFAAVLCVSSCEKTGPEAFTGSYTFKISGSVGLLPAVHIDKLQTDTISMNLVTEQGQMNISKDKSSGGVIVSWNDMFGNAYHTSAAVDGRVITLNQGKKSAALGNALKNYEAQVTYSGKGELYDNMLIIPMTYAGEFVVGGVTMTVVSSNVECVAKAN